MHTMLARAVRRLLGLYACAFTAVIAPVPGGWRACLLWAAVIAGMRRPVPVILSGTCMFIGECVAVRRPLTWTYDDPNALLQVPLWLLPLWILAAQFCVDMGDFFTHRSTPRIRAS